MDPYAQTAFTIACMVVAYTWGYHSGFKSACFQTGSFLLEIFKMKTATYLEDEIIFEDHYGKERKASEATWLD